MPQSEARAPVTPASPEPAASGGHGPVRVLLLAAVLAFVVGAGGFVASRTVARNRAVVAPMCIDSQCTAAMSADSSASMGMPAKGALARSGGTMSEGDALGQALSDLLRLLHLR